MSPSYTRLQREILKAIDQAFPKKRPWEAHNEPRIMEAIREGVMNLLGERYEPE